MTLRPAHLRRLSRNSGFDEIIVSPPSCIDHSSIIFILIFDDVSTNLKILQITDVSSQEMKGTSVICRIYEDFFCFIE